MRKCVLTMILTSLSFLCFSQRGFEPGYFINNNNEKTNCLIRHRDGYNPRSFKYKTDPNQELSQTGDISSVTEFGIGNTHKYKRFIVGFDRTADDINKLNLIRDPVNKTDTVFLLVLVEGKASLYLYEDGGLRRFFMQLENQPVQQLIYKQYLTQDRMIATNETYKQQVESGLQCGTPLNVQYLKYDKKDLAKVFAQYNSCAGGNTVDFTIRERSSFNITIRPGIKFGSLKLSRPQAPPVTPTAINISFEEKITFRLGFEGEFILPMNKYRVSLLFEPNFQYYSAVSTSPDNSSTIKYYSLELPMGVRYSLTPNGNASFFFNLLYAPELALSNSEIDYIGGSDRQVLPGSNFLFGAGLKFKKKYSVELRGATRRDLLKTNFATSANYSAFALIFGYKLNK